MMTAAEGARTPNLWFRRPTLYPVELQPHFTLHYIAIYLCSHLYYISFFPLCNYKAGGYNVPR